MAHPVSRRGWALVVLLAIVGSGCSSSGTSSSTANVTSVCDAVAKIGADYISLDNGEKVPTLGADFAHLRDQASSYGEPFDSEYKTAQSAADQNNGPAVRSALDTMAGSCTAKGFDNGSTSSTT